MPAKKTTKKRTTKKVAKKATKKVTAKRRLTSDYILKASAELEKILVDYHNAPPMMPSLRGKTLSIESKLPYPIVMALLKINHIRNTFAHEVNTKPGDVPLQFSLNNSNPENNPMDFFRLHNETKTYLLTNKLKYAG